MANNKALIFYTSRSSFVQKDVSILQKEYQTHEFNFYVAKKSQTPLKFLSQFFFLLVNIFSARLLVCQFAGYHSFLPALFGKVFGRPCLIIVGGTDAHNFPGIGYGNWQKKVLKTFTAWSFQLCTHIVPKHKTLMQCTYSYDTREPQQQGIYTNLSGLKTPFTEIPNGYDSEKWKCVTQKAPNTFITVSGGWEYPFQAQLKGIDLILAVAPSLPECEFAILGMPDESLLGQKPANVKILPPAKNENLPAIYSRYEYYLQLSMAEGFPNSLCEAMLCECVPVVSNVFSMPAIIGDSGFVLKHRDVGELKQLIGEALKADRPALGKKAHEIIAANYTFEARKNKLLALCNSLTKK
ncbi:MAG TPA: glycosyltransferase [Chitinophagales bacterium]|nr:glycosyltransferase [Chitinophagales bacterium]